MSRARVNPLGSAPPEIARPAGSQRSVVKRALERNPAEKRHASTQLNWNEQQHAYVFTEKVPRGCLTAATSVRIASVLLEGGSNVTSKHTLFLYLLVAALGPPLVTALVWGMIPLADPTTNPEFGDQLMFSFVLLPFANLVCFPGLALSVLAFIGVPVTTRQVLGFVCTFAFLYVGLQAAFSALVFPVPMGFVWLGSIGALAATFWIAVDAFGLQALLQDRAMLKRLACQVGVVVLCLIFLVVFSFYRFVFSTMSGGEQAFLAPLWPLLKVSFKKAGVWLVNKGENPDTGPLVNFALDMWAAMCGNFLFVDCADFRSVLAILLVDVIENLTIMVRCLFMFQKYELGAAKAKNAAHEAKLAVHSAKLAALGAELAIQAQAHAAELATLRRRQEKQERRLQEVWVQVQGDERSSLLERVGGHEGHADSLLPISRPSAAGAVADATTRLPNEPPPEPPEDLAISCESASIIHRNRALLFLTQLVTSEMSEILTSLWAVALLPSLYFGPNKAFYTGVRDLNNEGFKQAIWFSSLDFMVELGMFVLVCVFIQFTTRLQVLPGFIAYLEAKQLFWTFLLVTFSIPTMTIGFFLQHQGVDPSFDFAWLGDAEKTNSSRGGG